MIQRLFFAFAVSAAAICTLVSLRGAPIDSEASTTAFHRRLTFAERVEYQRKIEEIYWRHRIWPKERADPKPSLETVMSVRQIEDKVRDDLRNSRVLELYWQRPISSEQLQAEMERMAQHTKNPEMLRELFEALSNNSFVIAECLARPALSERLVNQFSETNPKCGEGLLRSRNAQRESATDGNSHAFSGYSLPAVGDDAGACPVDNSWTPLTDLPSRRAEHTAVWTGSEMIVWGGFNYDRALSTGDRYNPATDSWAKVSRSNAPSARGEHTAVWTGTEMIVWGGYTGNILNSGGRYDPATDSWKATSVNGAPTHRFHHTAWWTGTVMLVWGGEDPTGYTNTGGRYDPETDSWSTMNTTSAPLGRIQYSAVWTGNEMVIWGGRNGAKGYLNSGAKYNPISDTWTSTSGINAPQARFGHSAVWTGSEMILWGGFAGNFLSDGARYDPATNTWAALSGSNPPLGRYSHTAVWTGSEMVIWGGLYDFTQSTAGGRYNPTTNIWSPTNTNNAPTVRNANTTVWTGSEMIVFGGGGGESLNSGGRYNPTADTWTPVRTTNTPAGRYEHKAVWTGSEMIVWGGGFLTSATNTGARYDPALDVWTPTSMVNVPDARMYFPAVWTGTEMIVWGGWRPQGFDNMLNSGGRYNPATNNWTATTLTNAPLAKRWHSAVWTGSEMIVWGGENGVSSTNTGGRYNPNTDTWIATNTTNTPTPRSEHTAVWSGSEMIVFGGTDSNATNTGAKYDPVSDTWVPTSTNTPVRSGHTAIWTGNEMIVWGGSIGNFGASGFLNTGGRYTPSTDTWTATSLANAPDGRLAHSVVWTGDEMIVWGGIGAQERFFNTGGRYRASTDTWASTPTINAPNEGEYPTAVWTGSRMIVFGGYFIFYDSSGQSHDFMSSSGGAFCPQSDPSPARLANISTRAFVQTGDNVMFGGLIITGSGPKKVALRALGPSLSNFGIADALQDPVLELHDSTGALLATNDNWMDAPNKQEIIDSGLAPGHNFESVILTSLTPGSYTAIVHGVNNGTGTAVIEAYDLAQTASSKFGNISTRSFVKTGDNVMIGGLILGGSGSQKVVVRGIGPSLAEFGITNSLADPLLELRDGNGGLLATNDNWRDAPNSQAIIDSGLAPRHNLESAILTSLIPGSYTAVIRGVNNGTGVALVEVFGLN